MRELEFVPSWYPRTRRAARLVKIQALCTLLVATCLGSWLVAANRSLQQHRTLREQLDSRIEHSSEELTLLNEQMALKQQLQRQKEVMDRVGRHIESSRMLSMLEQMMTSQMALLSLSINTMEQVVKIDSAAKALRAGEPPIERLLQVKIVGVAPSDMDISEFLEKLSGVRFFEEVRLVEAINHAMGGHDTRKFEITFTLNLTRAGGGA